MTLARSGVTKRKLKPTRYKIWMRPAVHTARKKLPGHIRQRIKRSIDQLAEKPRPPRSKELDLPDNINPEIRTEWEVRRESSGTPLRPLIAAKKRAANAPAIVCRREG